MRRYSPTASADSPAACTLTLPLCSRHSSATIWVPAETVRAKVSAIVEKGTKWAGIPWKYSELTVPGMRSRQTAVSFVATVSVDLERGGGNDPGSGRRDVRRRDRLVEAGEVGPPGPLHEAGRCLQLACVLAVQLVGFGHRQARRLLVDLLVGLLSGKLLDQFLLAAVQLRRGGDPGDRRASGRRHGCEACDQE
jgi:hypothetical protein